MTMTDDELLSLLTDVESDRVERKASFPSHREEIGDAICAFANDLPGHGEPGVLFVGAHDDGTCAGLEVDDQLLQSLAGFRSDGRIQPLPTLQVEKRILNGCELAVVLVQPSLAPPVRYRGRTRVRVGPRRDVATADEERRLSERRRSSDLPYDLATIRSAGLADLDLDLFERTYLRGAVAPDVLEENRRELQDQLRALRLVDREGKPTVFGILTLGKDPREFVPGDYIQFIRFDGDSLSDPVRDQKEIDGPLPELLRRVDEVMEANNSTALDLDAGPTDVRRPQYPIAALQQLVRNAVLHRNYETSNAPVRVNWFSDRIEIQSPGGPFGQVTAENFGQPGLTDYRNPHLAEGMKVLGYVQRFGVGLEIARRALRENENPELELQAQPSHVLAIVRSGS